MSVDARTEMYEEVHGINKAIAETPYFLQEKLFHLDLALQRIPDNSKRAYKMAEAMNPGFVNDPKYRLLFLRAVRFDVNKAASRLVMFMETKLELFGRAVLTRPVYLSDLNDETQAMVKSGAVQLLPSRDTAGRAVVGHFRPLMTDASREEVLNTVSTQIALPSKERGLLRRLAKKCMVVALDKD